MTLKDTLETVDDSLPDGAWMETLCQLTGMDAGQVASGLQRLQPKIGQSKRKVNNNAAQ